MAEGEAAATMSRTRMPAIYQETTVHYEKAEPEQTESYELQFKPTLRPIGSSADTFESQSQTQSAESDVLPLNSKH